MSNIRFHTEDISFKLPKPRKTVFWLKSILLKEKAAFSFINFIFCSDKFLLELNQKYLSHSDYTDIITFQLNDKSLPIESEIYISIDRVKENAKIYEQAFSEELLRVMAHGILHLVGYKDKKPAEKVLMRKKESAYLSLFK